MQFRLVSFLYVALTLLVLIQANTDNAAAQAPSRRKGGMLSLDVSVGIFGQLTQARTPITSQQDSNGLFTTQKSQNV